VTANFSCFAHTHLSHKLSNPLTPIVSLILGPGLAEGAIAVSHIFSSVPKYKRIWDLHCVSKKLTPFKLSVTLSNLSRFSKFCTDGKHNFMKVATNHIRHYHLTSACCYTTLLNICRKFECSISQGSVVTCRRWCG